MLTAKQLGRGALFVLYTITCANVIIGPIVGTYYKIKEHNTTNGDEKWNYSTLSLGWYLSMIPLVGPILGIYAYCLSGMGN